MRRPAVPRARLLSLALVLPVACIALPPEDEETDSEGTGDSGEDDPSATAGPMDGSTGGDSSGDDMPDTTPPEPTARAVDIVFVVDNSGSMGEEQATLTTSIGALVSALDAAVPPVDYRIAVTTTDNGNPWCQGSSPEAGVFRATSCRERQSEFVFQGAQTIDATEEACLSLCGLDTLALPEPWIDVVNTSGTTNVPGDDVLGALACMLPQGINGCGFEQPLQSLAQALDRIDVPGESNFGFTRPGALLTVVLVTDEVDCSHNPDHETIFLPDGDKVFWSDPTAPAPTSAVCWNAGITCTGGGPFDCVSADFDADGNPAADPIQDAVIRPLPGYIADLSNRGAYVVAINGVSAAGTPVYQLGTDPEFIGDFGMGPGCESASGRAVPPVRIRELVDAVTGPGNLHSICDADFTPAMTSMANGILARLP